MKKKINIALVLIVLGLWGTAIYKVVGKYFFSVEHTLPDYKLNIEFNSDRIRKDTFYLEKIKRDPFLGRSTQEVSISKKKHFSSKKLVHKPELKTAIIWPKVTYHGYIKSKGKDQELVLVKVNNTLYKLRKKTQLNGIMIQRVYKDSIEVEYKKQRRVFILE